MTQEHSTPELNDAPKPAEEAHAGPPPSEVPSSEHVAAPAAEGGEAAAKPTFQWYVVKVQSAREDSIKDAIERRVKIEGLQDSFGQIIIPTEKVTEMRKDKRVIKERKLYPGYLMVQLEFNDRMLYLFRETSGVGDFVGGGLNKPPLPMKEHEVERMLGQKGMPVTPDVVKHKFDKGDRVSVKDGTFAGMEGEVKELLDNKGALRVELTIFGRPVPVELEYWQIDHT